MAPVILAMDVHCDSCAKKIRKAIMKVPGAESVTASYETRLVVVEGTADAAAVMARLRANTNKAVRVVSDGAEEEGEAAAAGASASGSVYANPPPPIVLEMDMHCRSCAEKVERRVMEIPGVDAVTTDVPGRRVEVTGTADASAVGTSLEVRMRRPVRVVSDPRSAGGAPAGYDHEWRKAAAARAAAEQTQTIYGADDASNHSSAPPSLVARPAGGRRRGRSASQRAPSPPVQQPARSGMPPCPPASSSYGAPPPEAGYYYYPARPGGVYGDQHWAAPAPPSGECFGQQWPAYPPPGPEPEGYCPYDYGGQPADNPGGCSIQ